MSYRYMRLLVMYDLPMTSKHYVKEYTKFRKYLLKEGYVMVQQSIYSKLCLNQDVVDNTIRRLEKNLPALGNVRALQVTEKQYVKIKIMVGHKSLQEQDQNDRRMVIL